MIHEINGFATITKTDDDKRMVYGIAQSDALDNQDEIVEWEATKDAIPDYEKWRNLREMHKDIAVGTVPEIEVKDIEKQLYIGAKVVDDDAWKKVKEGVYKGFSIGGRALERIKEFDTSLGKSISRVKKYVLNEISLVDRPANPECTFQIIKRDESDIPSRDDQLSKDVSLLRKMVHSLDKKILTKRQINKLGDNSFALIRKSGDKKQRMYPVPDKAHAKALLKQLMSLKVTDRERHVVHEKIKKVLGSKHSLDNCEYCRRFVKFLENVEGGDEVMDRDKLMQAKALIDELLAEAGEMGDEMGGEEEVEEEYDYDGDDMDYEGQRGDDGLGAETEDIVRAPEKDETENISELQGSRYSDKEGADFEGFDALDGYKVGMDAEDSETHLYDDESQRKSKAEMEGGDCPYCGATLKALMSGQFRKNSAKCPGCGTEYGVEAAPKVTLHKRGSRRVMRKSSSFGGQAVGVLANLAKAVSSINGRLEKMESKPKPRKVPRKISKFAGASEEVETNEGGLVRKKMPESLEVDMNKSLAIVKSARLAGRALTPDEEAFNQSVFDRSIDFKVGVAE